MPPAIPGGCWDYFHLPVSPPAARCRAAPRQGGSVGTEAGAEEVKPPGAAGPGLLWAGGSGPGGPAGTEQGRAGLEGPRSGPRGAGLGGQPGTERTQPGTERTAGQPPTLRAAQRGGTGLAAAPALFP